MAMTARRINSGPMCLSIDSGGWPRAAPKLEQNRRDLKRPRLPPARLRLLLDSQRRIDVVHDVFQEPEAADRRHREGALDQLVAHHDEPRALGGEIALQAAVLVTRL